MRYIKGKIHFNKDELMRLEMCNPTLFELAQYVAEKAHITAIVMGENWVNVRTSSNDEQLLCPSVVFHVPGTKLDSGDHKCFELRCWSVYNEPSKIPDKTYRPCWFRRWNDFVSDMKSDYNK